MRWILRYSYVVFTTQNHPKIPQLQLSIVCVWLVTVPHQTMFACGSLLDYSHFCIFLLYLCFCRRVVFIVLHFVAPVGSNCCEVSPLLLLRARSDALQQWQPLAKLPSSLNGVSVSESCMGIRCLDVMSMA